MPIGDKNLKDFELGEESTASTGPETTGSFNQSGATHTGPGLSDAPSRNSYLQFANHFQQTSRLTQSAKEYCDALRNLLGTDTPESDFVSQEIMAFNTPCLYVGDKQAKYGILLAFHEARTMQSDDAPITTNVVHDAARVLAEDYQCKLLQDVMVVPEDYPRVEKMAKNIANALMAQRLADSGIEGLSVDTFQNRETLIYDTDIDKVRAFVDQHSPHGITARDDFGVILYMTNTSGQQNVWSPKANQGMYGHNPQQQDEIPLLAITGYPEFIRNDQSRMQELQNYNPAPQIPGMYTPPPPAFDVMLHITNIEGAIPSPGLLPLALSIFVQSFVAQQEWHNPFLRIDTKNRPNIGCFFRDKDSKHLHLCENPEEAKSYLQSFFNPIPFVCLDICEGRFKLPGLNKLLYDQNEFMSQVSKFMGYTIQSQPNAMGAGQCLAEFVGGLKLAQSDYDAVGTSDTRRLDYLQLTIGGREHEKAESFVSRKSPYERAKDMIEAAAPLPIRWIYLDRIVILGGQFVQDINQGIQRIRITPRNVKAGVGFQFQDLNNVARISGITPFASAMPQQPVYGDPALGNNLYYRS